MLIDTYCSMSTIKISKNTRVVLSSLQQDNESVDKIINDLFDNVADGLNDDFTLGYININLSKETMNRIKSFKAYDSETYEHILLRALNLYMGSINR